MNQNFIQGSQESAVERADHYVIRDLIETLFVGIKRRYALITSAHKIEERDVLQVSSVAIYLTAYHVKCRYLTNFLHQFLQLSQITFFSYNGFHSTPICSFFNRSLILLRLRIPFQNQEKTKKLRLLDIGKIKLS